MEARRSCTWSAAADAGSFVVAANATQQFTTLNWRWATAVTLQLYQLTTHTASDINPIAIQNLKLNATLNEVKIEIVQSDLFDALYQTDFSLIIINPPYYPKNILTQSDLAWYCGENFEYFKKLFFQLNDRLNQHCRCLMILSEDCDLLEISSLASKQSLRLEKVYEEKGRIENNFVFEITK